MEGFDSLMDAFLILCEICVPIIIIVLLVLWIIQKLTGGRAVLYLTIQKYGYDHAFTISSLKDIVSKILDNEGYDVSLLSLAHEVGNRYFGDFSCNNETIKHNITVKTDGYFVDYIIDEEPTKRYKP